MCALPIGGFMPIPLAMMIPFMAVQSIVMGDSFGKAYQFGKRRISAMSNEEFNKLSMSDLISDMQVEFKKAIPSINQSIDDATILQNKIIKEMLLILPRFVAGDTSIGGATKGQIELWQNMIKGLSSDIKSAIASSSGYSIIPQSFAQEAPTTITKPTTTPTQTESVNLLDPNIGRTDRQFQNQTLEWLSHNRKLVNLWSSSQIRAITFEYNEKVNALRSRGKLQEILTPTVRDATSLEKEYQVWVKERVDLLQQVLVQKRRFLTFTKRNSSGNTIASPATWRPIKSLHNNLVLKYYSFISRFRTSSNLQIKIAANRYYKERPVRTIVGSTISY